MSEYNVRGSLSTASHQLGQCPQCSQEVTWSTILKSADALVAFDRAICEVNSRNVPTTVLRRSADKQWFDASCRRAYDDKQTAYHVWCRARNAEHLSQFVLVRAKAQRVYGAAR